MSTARTTLFALVLGALPVVAQNWSHWQWTDWPQWLGPHRNGISSETGLFGKVPSFRESWRVHAGPGSSGLSVVGDRLYTMYIHSGEAYAVCLDARNGEVMWRTPTTGNDPSGQRDSRSPRATPTVDGKMVYVFSAHGKFLALDSQFGTQRWSRDIVLEFDSVRGGKSFGASPLVDRNLVLIEAGGKNGHSLMAFDKTNGEVAWNTGSDERGYSSPIIATIGQTRQAVFFTGYGLIAVAPQKGRVLWQYPYITSQSTNAATPVFIPPNRFFISSSSGMGGSVVEVTATDKGYEVAEVWRNNNMQNHSATSIYYQGHLYGFDGSILKCLDAETGEEKWQARGYGKGTLIVADGHLVILGERCNLGIAEATPAGFVEKANVQVSRRSRCETVPSLADGRIYLRDDKEIVCMNINLVGATQ
ncbi:MAG: PQQ-binding-like beta-propeller repeat protein [Gemmatimonadetes bacterium]|nr:PQQ-binding-like beta-propeller repeat protein [Gemmatimonadota bacterium]MXY81170.1 PQQ-binding-like beta-propeller repeat protein [Gemmatimonadota bacterium]MYB72119.1 PQQ-binding-like beta-propeller repeat protein [Gemmatimonadota bacterium]